MDKQIKQFLKTIKLNESLLSMFFGIVTVILVGVLVIRVYNANKPEISQEAEETAMPSEKLGEVTVTTKEDGKKYPTELPESYTIQPGDHLWMIAEKHYGSGYNWVDIAEANNISNPSLVNVGQELKLPQVAVKEVTVAAEAEETPEITIKGDTYKVEKGDNLWSISVRAYGDGYQWSKIAEANELANPNYIEIEQELKLPR